MSDVLESASRWYVVQTQPHGETRAVENLERQGFSTYLPRYQKTWRHARKARVVAAALFPRYLFVSFDPARQRWLPIRSTVGVSRLVCQGDRPLPVPEGIVEGLKIRQGEDGLVRLGMPPGLRPGDHVRVRSGAFEDSLGLVESVRDEDRVTILLDLLGRKVRVTVGGALIAAA